MGQELKDYVQSHLQSGFTPEVIQQELSKAGWSQQDINNAFGNESQTNPGGKLKSGAVLLSESFQLFKSRFWTIIFIHALGFLGIILATFTSLILLTSVSLIIKVIAVILLFVIAGFSSLLAQISLFYNLNSEYNSGWKESYFHALRLFWSYVWVVLLVALVPFGAFILFGALDLIPISLVFILGLNKAFIIPFTILLIIPAALFFIWFCFAALVVIVENERGFNALAKSRTYSKGKWWAIFLRVIFPVLLAAILQLLFRLTPLIIQNTFTIFLEIFYVPLLSAYMILLYKDVKHSHIPSVQVVGKTFYKILAAISVIIIILGLSAIGVLIHYAPQFESTLQNAYQTNQETGTPVYTATITPISTPITYYIDPANTASQTPNDTVIGQYILENLNRGVQIQDIRTALVSAGWSPQDIDKMIAAVRPPVVANTSNLQTYSNAKYGYSIEYPLNWKINVSDANGDLSKNTTYTSQGSVQIVSGGPWTLSPNGDSDARDALNFQVAKPDPAITQDQFMAAYPNFSHTTQNLIINGYTAVRYTDTASINGYQLSETLIKGNTVIYIFMTFNSSEANNIISTFKPTQ